LPIYKPKQHACKTLLKRAEIKITIEDAMQGEPEISAVEVSG